MIYIAHRINTQAELSDVPTNFGVELDLRPGVTGDLILQHDPLVKGEKFADYLKRYKHGLMILNIKSEGIEHEVVELLQENGIKEYFFLDCSFPKIHWLSSRGETQIALRFSEFEGLDTLEAMQGRAQWVWADCFTQFPLNAKNWKQIKDWGYQVCLVSPELQGRVEDIATFAKKIKEEGIVLDAICSKVANIETWRTLLPETRKDS